MDTVNFESPGEPTLMVASDENTAKEAAHTLVSELNRFLDYLKKDNNRIKNRALSSVKSLIDDHKSELDSLGIKLGKDVRLEIDDA